MFVADQTKKADLHFPEHRHLKNRGLESPAFPCHLSNFAKID